MKLFSQVVAFNKIMILLFCSVISSVSCSQDQLHTPVSQKQNKESQQQISEGLIGQIKTRSGEPVVGAMIIPTPNSSDAPPIPEIAITTDTAGHYEWPLQPGLYKITIISDGYQTSSQDVEIRANHVSTLDFVLDVLP
jgi:hypothetical protein